jgi:hypothetical protein
LVKDDVGKCKPTTFRLPPQGFVYGKPEGMREGGGSIIAGNYEANQTQKSK